MKKFKFDTRLQETVLKRGIGQQPTVTIDGEEKRVGCPVFVGTGTRDIPYLVKKVKENGNEGYSIVAVSFDDRNEEEKYWICIQPILIEKVVGFSVESNQMNEMAGDCSNVSGLPATGRGCLISRQGIPVLK